MGPDQVQGHQHTNGGGFVADTARVEETALVQGRCAMAIKPRRAASDIWVE
jgi:hypothetical protein